MLKTIRVRRPNLEALYKEVDNYVPVKENPQPPRVGISANRRNGLSYIAETYMQAVLDTGGAPVFIPVITDLKALTVLVSELDGLVISGGGDINPLHLYEEPIPQLQDIDALRDEYDLILLRLVASQQIPIMGICRGHQIVNVAFGGSTYQNIHSQANHALLEYSQTLAREYPSHMVTLGSGMNRLRTTFNGDEQILINSFHYQIVKEVTPELRTAATAPGGINEAMEHTKKTIFGVQWHPKAMTPQGDKAMKALFAYHTENARRFARAKAIHRRIVTIGSHIDTPVIFPGESNAGEKEGGKMNPLFMEEGHIDATFMVAYIPQGKRDEASLQAATAYAIERLNQVKRQQALHPDRMVIVTTPQEIRTIKAQGKKAICLGIESGYVLGRLVENLRMFEEMGVSYIALYHNRDNDICDSAKGKQEWEELSPFGKEVVRKMSRLGIMVDTSHAAESTFYQVLEVNETPIMASHSSARTPYDHPRNLTDDQLKALAAQGGVAQICLYKGFISKEEEKASLSNAIRHTNHIVDLVGVDYVGVSSGFGGSGKLISCSTTNELINITVQLLEEGYTEEDIQKIRDGNLLRVMTAIQDFPNR